MHSVHCTAHCTHSLFSIYLLVVCILYKNNGLLHFYTNCVHIHSPTHTFCVHDSTQMDAVVVLFSSSFAWAQAGIRLDNKEERTKKK